MMISFIHWSRALKCVFFAIVLAAAGSPTTHDKIFPFNESRFLMQHGAAVGVKAGFTGREIQTVALRSYFGSSSDWAATHSCFAPRP